jgi:16S rRNA (guanine527-N7)-methyltransferase
MDPNRIAALLEPFLDRPLPPPALEQISMYIDLLLRWNSRINLTAIRHPEDIVTRHFGESFFLACHLFPPTGNVERTLLSAPAPQPLRSVGPHTPMLESPTLSRVPQPSPSSTSTAIQPRVLDIGSGAGFPALPLKIYAPQIDLTLIESNHKRAAFLREVARALTLTNINVMTARAETLAAPAGPHAGVVTFRAVERFESVLPVATKLLAPQGRLALLIGARQVPTLSTLAPNLSWARPVPIPNSQARVLSIGTLRRAE